MKGLCIDASQSLSLQPGQEYFLFPAGKKAYYVSRFNRKEAHFGCYQAERFQPLQDNAPDWPQEPPGPQGMPELDRGTIYAARLVWRSYGYRGTPLGILYIKPGKTHGHFWRDPELKQHGGCYPLHWFTDFRPLDASEPAEVVPDLPESVPDPVEVEPVYTESEQLSFF